MPLGSGNFDFKFDLKKIASALGIVSADVVEYFTDGRRMSFILERKVEQYLAGSRPESEGAEYDVIDADGRFWEVRCLTKDIYFCPSYMVGSSRKFDEQGFLDKLDKIDGYIVGDIVRFPQVPCWFVESDLVRQWWDGGLLGTTTSIARKKFYRLIGAPFPD